MRSPRHLLRSDYAIDSKASSSDWLTGRETLAPLV